MVQFIPIILIVFGVIFFIVYKKNKKKKELSRITSTRKEKDEV
jgi:preprotein translocase subunit YajC